MKLTQRFSYDFSQVIRDRGKNYHRQGRVALHEIAEEYVIARVTGTSLYHVRVDWSWTVATDAVHVACTCPYFRRGEFCKHLWATLLHLDGEYPKIAPPEVVEMYLSPLPPETALNDGPLVREDLDDEFGDDFGDLLGDDLAEELPVSLGSSSLFFDLDFPFLVPSLPSSLAPKRRTWRGRLGQIAASASVSERESYFPQRPRLRTKRREILYRLCLEESAAAEEVVIFFFQREETQSGDWGKVKPLKLSIELAGTFTDPRDEELFELLRSAAGLDASPSGLPYWRESAPNEVTLSRVAQEVILPRLCATGRLGWLESSRDDPDDALPLAWDDGPPWSLELDVEKLGDEARLVLWLSRGKEDRLASDVLLLLSDGALVVFPESFARLESRIAVPWLREELRAGEMTVPVEEIAAFQEELWSLPAVPPVHMPEEWRLDAEITEPRPHLELIEGDYSQKAFDTWVYFDYGEERIAATEPGAALVDLEAKRLTRRDRELEARALDRLVEVGFNPPRAAYVEAHFQIPPSRLESALPPLVEEGWSVEVEGQHWRRSRALRLGVSSGVDWFDLEGEASFEEGASLALPELLAAVRRGQRSVRLDDGSRGLLPTEWLERYGSLARLAEGRSEDGVRFRANQAFLLDALLQATPEVDVDAGFERARERLSSFEKVEPAGEPRGFRGELRGYQREGLGWLRFLRELGFGGCLADDMGLGKTIQVLALLQSLRLGPPPAGGHRPSLVVAPRSLIYNWLDEAARFTPRLRMLDYTGTGRRRLRPSFGDHDVIVTTYGIVRRDAAELAEIGFELVVLDEAQAIKNPSSQGAKACRLLDARHRLALTGTPVENHLGELWSLFEFLNPGMLGRLKVFQEFTQGERSLDVLARALRPLILRRTKRQVLPELPEKTEQTLHCELRGQQRRLYRELRDHYRSLVGERVESVGLNRSKIQVLEALLRLRQAACHPGLIDPERRGEKSAKLDALFEQLEEVLGEGHKALVFSQFVSLLEIVRRGVDERSWDYAYLDGRTRKRREQVERFQNDPDCRLFLISLKAGGQGLNLTGADYVFLLDPWWNPAVEAQAVDRAHRIGQERPVFVYRLIARDTVEEKIVELQRGKRELAEAILRQDKGFLKELTAEDLRLLLS